MLGYLVPKPSIVRKFNDVDSGGYRVLLNKHGKWEVLFLVWEVNGTPYSLCSAEQHRILRLPDGTEGAEARCTSIEESGKQSRISGFYAHIAYYRNISTESAKYFDEIIDSMCYESGKN
jgi:hypothetical protein